MTTKQLIVLPDEMEIWVNSLVTDEVYFIQGNDSIFVPSINTRIIDRTACREWPNLDGEMELMTPGQAARLELRRFFPDANLRAHKQDFKLLDIASPMLFQGQPYYGMLFYLDLCGAYASIYRWLTLDCVWPRGIGEMSLAPIAARLSSWKTSRNSVVGTTRAYEMTGVRGRAVKAVRFRNHYFNPALWHTIQAVLHDIARLCVQNGAIYIATDCAIFKQERGYKRCIEYLEGLQFELHKGQGIGAVRGWGSYVIEGFKKTARPTSDTPINNLCGDGVTLKWLEKIIKNHRG